MDYGSTGPDPLNETWVTQVPELQKAADMADISFFGLAVLDSSTQKTDTQMALTLILLAILVRRMRSN